MWIFNEMEDQVEWWLFLKQIYMYLSDLDLGLEISLKKPSKPARCKSPSYKKLVLLHDIYPAKQRCEWPCCHQMSNVNFR